MNDAHGRNRPARVLVTKIGLDGHDRGSRLVAKFLRDAGMEVHYTGPWQQIPDVVALARDQNVDIIGISSLASDHLIVPKLMERLSEAGLGHVAVVIGGIVPDYDLDLLKNAGVAHVFHPGTSRAEIVDRIEQLTTLARATELTTVT